VEGAQSFSAQLRRAADPIWEAQHQHPFVRGVADGSLPVERFARYVRQDYLFLIDYARLLALGAARAPDLATMRRFAELAQATLVNEMDLHRAYARRFGVSEADLQAEDPDPRTRAYTDFLLRTGATGDFAELAAALLPCMWGYAEIGARLAQGARPADERYADWIDAYAAPDFAQLADWCRGLVDRLGRQASETGRRRMHRAFIASSEHELAFWDVAAP
jgi:thiaminase/transcriptional activator TenA